SYKEGIHLRMAFGDKTEVNGIRIGPPLFEPEEEASVISEAFKVWVTILAFIVQKICDPERLESLRVKRDRTRKITHGHDDVVEHRIPPCLRGCVRRRVSALFRGPDAALGHVLHLVGRAVVGNSAQVAYYPLCKMF